MMTMSPVLTHGRSVWDQAMFPRDECEERLWLAQVEMAKRGLSGLVVLGTAIDYGHLCFLTQHVPQANWSLAVVPFEGEPTFVTGVSGGRELPAMRARTWLADVRNFRKLAPDLAALLDERGIKGSVGLAGMGSVKAGIHEQVLEGLSGCEIVQADELLDGLRRSLRSREVTAIRCALDIAVAARAVLEAARQSGASNTAAMVEAERTARRLGALDFRGLVGQDADGQLMPVEAMTPYRGGPLVAYLAVNHLGYWADLAVTIGGGPLLDRANTALRAMAEAARPGTLTGDLAAAAERGVDPAYVDSARLYGYGGAIGLALNSSPAVKPGGAAALVEGTVLSLHIRLSDGATPGVFVSNVLLLTPGGSRGLLKDEA